MVVRINTFKNENGMLGIAFIASINGEQLNLLPYTYMEDEIFYVVDYNQIYIILKSDIDETMQEFDDFIMKSENQGIIFVDSTVQVGAEMELEDSDGWFMKDFIASSGFLIEDRFIDGVKDLNFFSAQLCSSWIENLKKIMQSPKELITFLYGEPQLTFRGRWVKT